MRLKLIFFAFIACFNVILSEIVEFSDGKVEGTLLRSRLQRQFYGFFKIPYAEPPVKDLRFQAPRPVKKWAGILDATKPGPICFQKRRDAKMSEDCLHLNVFTRNLTKSRPVLVFIHGGGFETGSSLDQGPEHLMDRRIVVVTINYRLGALGFLAMGTKEVPGNSGMKDQVLALKWVKKNIEKFGGNKNQITIAGYSAGAFSVTSHMASSMSKNLFHRAIAMSGSITTAMALASDNKEMGKKLGELLKCKTDKLIECLKKALPFEIVQQEIKEYPECEIVIWMPVVEQDFGQERFFSEQPVKLFETGMFNKVPIIIGRTSDEFISPVPRLLASTGIKELNKNFHKMAPHCFFYRQDEDKSNLISDALRKTFLPLDPIDVRSFNGLNYLFGDGVIGYPVHKLVNLISSFTDVYYYKFSYIGRYGFNYPHNKPYGVNHGDDLQYTFFDGPVIRESDPENFMVERMTKLFEYFALNGNPNYDSKEFNWPKHDSSLEFYMDIGANMVEKNGLFLERYSVWDNSLSVSDKNYCTQKSLVVELDYLAIDDKSNYIQFDESD